MLQRLFILIFSKTAIGRYLDGKKTLIGAVLIVLAHVLEALEHVVRLFPETAWLGEVLGEGRVFYGALTETLDSVGLGLLSLGLAHKAVKAKEAKKE